VVEIDLGVCSVRSWRWDDRESIVRHANNRKVWINLRDRFPHPYTLGDADRWLRLVGQMRPETHFAIAVGGPAVGGIGITLLGDVHRRSGEMGYWLGEEFWGRGIATAAVRAVTRYAFSTYDLCRIHAAVFEWNPASMRVLEKAGYVLEGRLRQSVTKDGRTIDQFLYAITRSLEAANHTEPSSDR
jgi:RimJ/RimL family protein N-acetyltransferase